MILEKVLATIRKNELLVPEDRVLVAVSGGPDSVALLHLLIDLRTVLPLSLVVGHLDHALRDTESKQDRAFVERLCKDLGLECVSGREEVATLARRERRSIEEAGREARRRFLRRVAQERMCRRVAFGHQRDDQAESVLLRLVAGAGRSGLSGIKPVSEGLFVRPLLDCGRAEILRYLGDRAIEFRTDASNADRRFPRNRMRHGVLPLLVQEFNPRVVEAIARTADLLREEDAFLERTARGILRGLVVPLALPTNIAGHRSTEASAFTPVHQGIGETDGGQVPRYSAVSEGANAGPASSGDDRAPAGDIGIALDAQGLARLAPAIGRRVMRLALRHAGLRGRDLAKARIDDVLQLACREETNLSLSLGEFFVAHLEYGRLILKRDSGAGSIHGYESIAEVFSDGAHASSASSISLPGGGDAPGTRAGSGPSPSAFTGASSLDPRPPNVPLPMPGTAAVEHLGLILSSRIVPVESVVGEYGCAPSNRAYLDADLLESPLLIRTPRAGDRFWPLGAPGTRKLSDVWTDLRVPHEARRRSLLVESSGRIAWAVGLRPGHPFRITDRTRRVAVLESLPLERQEPSGLAKAFEPPRMSSTPNERSLSTSVVTSESLSPGRSAAQPGSGAEADHSDVPADVSASDSTQRPILYTPEQIADAVNRIAQGVSAWAQGRELVLLGVLHGSFIFLSDLLRRLSGPVRVGFLDRDGGLASRGLVLEGARVLVVEDILDTGESLVRVLARVQELKPLEIRTCVLFDKVGAIRTVPIEIDYRGLTVPNLWVVGYGLDQDGRERNLPYLTHL